MIQAASRRYFIGYEKGWKATPCKYCGKGATWHGYLFKDPPPGPPAPDQRKPVGEVFGHEETDDCVALSDSER